MNEELSPEVIEAWGKAVASLGSMTDEAGRAFVEFGRSLRAAFEMAYGSEWSDHTHGMTLEELLGEDVTELIRVSRVNGADARKILGNRYETLD